MKRWDEEELVKKAILKPVLERSASRQRIRWKCVLRGCNEHKQMEKVNLSG